MLQIGSLFRWHCWGFLSVARSNGTVEGKGLTLERTFWISPQHLQANSKSCVGQLESFGGHLMSAAWTIWICLCRLVCPTSHMDVEQGLQPIYQMTTLTEHGAIHQTPTQVYIVIPCHPDTHRAHAGTCLEMSITGQSGEV